MDDSELRTPNSELNSHPLGFDPKLVEDSGEWKIGGAEVPPEPPETEPAEVPIAKRPVSFFRNISFLFMFSAAGGSVGTWGIHALNCDGTVENGVVGTAEAATQLPALDSSSPGPSLQQLPTPATNVLPDIHEPLVPTPYTPHHILTPIEQRFYSNLSRQNPNKDPVLYCRQEGGNNDLVDVVQQPAGATDCAHLYRSLTGKYFYVNGQLAEEAGGTVDGLLGKQAAQELDYRVERNGRFVKQEKPHGIKVGDTIHFAPYQDREKRNKYARR